MVRVKKHRRVQAPNLLFHPNLDLDMSARLASFRGPSTPTSSPVKAPQSAIPASPSRSAESTYHRKVRTLLQELRTVAQNWDDIVLVDGLKAARSLVDARTELECALLCIYVLESANKWYSL